MAEDDLPYRIELWDEADTRVEDLIALCSDDRVARAAGRQQENGMTRIYVSDYGSDRNDGLTKQTAIYSWKRAKKLFAGHIEISVDTAMTRKRLMKEIQSQRLLRDSPASRFRLPPLV